jgi:hypothetical protein
MQQDFLALIVIPIRSSSVSQMLNNLCNKLTEGDSSRIYHQHK